MRVLTVPPEADVAVDPPDDIRDDLEGVLRAAVARKGVLHAVIAVERGDRSLRWIGAAGDANRAGELMRDDTPFFLASVTKLYTAAAVLKLQERGLVVLEESITSYLPQELVAGIHRLDDVDHSQAITVRHLLSHTSGLADYFEGRPKGGRSLADQVIAEGDRAFGIEDVTRILREGLSPHFPPQPSEAGRQRAHYSDTNYQLLGAIIESATGDTLQGAFDDLLFQPLGLRDTYLYGHVSDAARQPASFMIGDQPFDLPLTMSSLGPDGGLVGTASDALAFLRALTRGEVFDDADTLRLMGGRWNRLHFSLNPAELRVPRWPIQYGLGMMRFRLPRPFTGLWSMPAVVGHSGATGSWLFHCPEQDILLTGTVDQAAAAGMPYQLIPKLLRIVARAA